MAERKRRLLEHLPSAFKLVLGVLVVSLSILGWLLLEQNNRLQEERYQERVGLAADRLVQILERRVTSLRGRLEDMTVDLTQRPHDVATVLNTHRGPWVAVHLRHDQLEVHPPEALHYVPSTYAHRASTLPWAAIDRLEFAGNNPAGAQLMLEAMLSSARADERAGTLARLGRVRQRLGDIPGALAAYAELAKLQGQYVESVPAPWLAGYARCAIQTAEQNHAAFEAELTHLVEMLREGGYHVSRATYSFYARAANDWLDSTPLTMDPLPLDWTVSNALSALSLTYSEWLNGLGEPSGFSILGEEATRQVMLWRTAQSGLLGVVLPLQEVADQAISDLGEELSGSAIGWQINDGSGGHLVSDGSTKYGIETSRTLDFGNITLLVGTFQTRAMLPEPADQMRRQLLLWGLILALAVITAGTIFLARTLRREAEIAALQAEFVAAVSHEFRTPLTSIRQL